MATFFRYGWVLWSLLALMPKPGMAAGFCPGEAPLIASSWESIQVGSSPVILGTWKLPVSSHQPEVVTSAQAELTLHRDPSSDSVLAEIRFWFSDPKPGIPFTFQLVALQWESDGQARTALIDWSENCSRLGKSLFPGGSLSGAVDLGEHSQPARLGQFELKLWGSRN